MTPLRLCKIAFAFLFFYVKGRFVNKRFWLVEYLEYLGAVFIKLGQSLSLKPYLVGEVIAKNLESLHDKVKIDHSWNKIQKIIKAEMGESWIDENFLEFCTAAKSSASIAAVYKATTKDGKSVAVKIVKTWQLSNMQKDISILIFLAKILNFFPKYKVFKLPLIIQNISDLVKLEFNMTEELQNTTLLRSKLVNDDNFYIPLPYKSLSSKSILVTEWINDVPLSSINLINELKLDKQKIIERIVQFYCIQVYRDGVFHADLHPGNLFISTQYRLTAIDCGLISTISEQDRIYLGKILYFFIKKNYKAVSNIYLKAGYISQAVDIQKFEEFLSQAGGEISFNSNNSFSIASFLSKIITVTRKFGIEPQEKLLLLQKTMLYVEATCSKINKDSNIWTIMQPWIETWAIKNISPEAEVLKKITGFAKNVIKDLLSKLTKS